MPTDYVLVYTQLANISTDVPQSAAVEAYEVVHKNQLLLLTPCYKLPVPHADKSQIGTAQ